MANFIGQTAVITGGAQGIGLATAKRFINDGCEVMIWDIDKKLGMDAAKELNCHFLEVDQTDNQLVEKATADTIMAVMDGAREAGVYNISLASEPQF